MNNLDPQDFLKAKLGKLPLRPPTMPNDDEEGELHDSLGSLTYSNPSSSRKTSSRQAHAPISGSEFFNEALSVTISDEAAFRVYYSAPVASQISGGTVFVCHHGAGYSGLSFARFAEALKATQKKGLGVLALDARGHGKSKAKDEADLSLGRMSTDLVRVLKELFPDRTKAPKLVLVGHSMGGAVVVDACNTIQAEVSDVLGLVVLDIVEGSAMEALSAMMGLIQSRPKSFNTAEEAIAWHVTSKTLHNIDSARVSIPPCLVPSGDAFTWRTDLSSTQPFWTGWYENLSKKFLSARTAKLLVLAGTDRLDTELTIGQMQGKYQMTVFPDVGHCLHEDAPERLAALVLDFWKRNDRTDILKHVKKVGS